MEVTDANGLDPLRKRFEAILIPKISGVKATELMPRFEGAWGRFNERQDDRGEAEAVASGRQKGKAYAQQVYQGRRRSSMERRKEKAQKPGLEKPERKRVARPSLEELEHERREAERARVKGLRAAARRRKLR